ncbi:MAG: tRNA threonylcarbamoyl adenosine modification protein (Sua5/YciO/YrdC/YwlC family) [Dinoroseobacter sp.]|jgi:tRNA threonylcarbamoyl adenosine modification protein (Sua5/YciO/YrdC/YwlC family)
MAQYFHIHPQNPQRRLIKQAAEILRGGGLVAYPTDSSYALGCHLDDKRAVDRIRKIRRLDRHHNFTLVASDLKQVSQFAKLDNEQYRLIKAVTPGPYTFILNAKRSVPNRLVHPKRRSIGIRIPATQLVQELLAELGEPIMSSSLILPNAEIAMGDPEQIREKLEHDVDLVIDAGLTGNQASTVIDWHGSELKIVRYGAGDVSFLQD